MCGRRQIPLATYRLQFNPGFRFRDAELLVPYLHRLGISDIYASPVLKARRGSAHGYDITDPTTLNPERISDPRPIRLYTPAPDRFPGRPALRGVGYKLNS